MFNPTSMVKVQLKGDLTFGFLGYLNDVLRE